MIPAAVPRFVRDRYALDELLTEAKQLACPNCHHTGEIVGHGLLIGNAERGNEREVRGRRLLCSARFRRPGCGRTFSVLLATVVEHFSVRTPTLSTLLELVVGGATRKVAWERLHAGCRAGLALRTCYRLWARLVAAQSHLRTALCRLGPPPATADARAIAQVLAHLRTVISGPGCLLAGFQLVLQRGVFG
jgi:transposase-like protein